MRVLINLENTDDIREIYLENNESVQDLKYIIEAEFNIPQIQQEIKYEGNVLSDDKKGVAAYNVKEDEILTVGKKVIGLNLGNNLNIGGGVNTNTSNTNTNTNNNNSGLGGFNMGQIFDNTMKMIKTNNPNLQANTGNNPNAFNNLFQNFNTLDNRVKQECNNLKSNYLNDPSQLAVLFNTDEELATVLVSHDDNKLHELIKARISKYEDKRKKEQDERTRLMNADPNDPEVQKQIEEMNRLERIDENLRMAHEYLPESFSMIHMLYINLEINKMNMVALVDTGAQTTIISEHLAKKCGIYSLCDTRYAGIAKGVGTSKILGVVHAATIKIGDRFIMCKLTVIENNSIGCIFGLDNMRSHQCTIDLSKSMLIFPHVPINVNFLSDGEIVKIKSEMEDFESDMEDEVEKAKKESFKDLDKK